MTDEILTQEARNFLDDLHRRFDPSRLSLLQQRERKAEELARSGGRFAFLPETESIRSSNWQVPEAPRDLVDRRVEITGPAERRMMINGLNSGANVFMADFEDSLAPTWLNVIEGQKALFEAVRRTLEFRSPGGKHYKLNTLISTLVVRPRGWHLIEKHYLVDGKPISASLFDFGLYFFHNAQALMERDTGPYFYLPKMESHLEARLWREVFDFSEDALGLKRGSIRATVLIETLPAVFEMDEILFELREHALGLNAGRWDYIFSAIKKLGPSSDFIFPDRGQIQMTVPFLRAYTDAIIEACHRRGAHAIGGMAAFVPSRKSPEFNERALERVREDKLREARDGFDGTWVAHPDLVPVAMQVFDEFLKDKPNQIQIKPRSRQIRESDLTNFQITGGKLTEQGVRSNISVALQYLEHWLKGTGAVAISNLMEDVATAEIARAQLWQWVYRRAVTAEGHEVTPSFFQSLREQEVDKLKLEGLGDFRRASEILDGLVLNESCAEFLTVPAYRYID
ncbi:MAG: malate synthase A [Bdellovibrionota bacterium]